MVFEVVAIAIRQYALKNSLWQMFFGCEQEVTTRGGLFLFLYYDTRRYCNKNHPTSLKPTLILFVIYFQIPVSSRSFNHLTAFRILLNDMVNNGTSKYSNILPLK